MHKTRWLVLLLCCLPLSCSPHPDDITLQGSGATFPAPLYKRWFLEFYKRNPRIRVNYQAIGSGAGIRQFTEGLTDFGASDAAMNDKELAAAEKARGAEVLMLPMTAGSVALCYNIPGVRPSDPPLRLSRKLLVEILFGRIDSWDDRRIEALNPQLRMPSLPISWIRRSEGSGTTYAFTNHISAISSEWKKEVGVNKSVTWPTGLGAKGNNGVAALIEQTPGALGYVEFGYAELTKLPMAALENRAGAFVLPGLESGQAALAEEKLPANFRLFVADPKGTHAYPIVTYTWMLVLKRYPAKKAEAIRRGLRYCLTEGQHFSNDLGYIPLPETVTRRILAAVDQIEAQP